jgi:aspartyl-tRNA(Asn)/glutamyl-tRNA(Gln) amidotransferase subunit A
VLGSYFLDRVQTDVASAFQDAVAALRGLGAEIVECDWADAEAARAVALASSRVESASVHRTQLREAPELMGEALRSRLEVGAILTADTYIRARQARKGIRDSIGGVYRQHRLDAIVAPTLPATAPRADEDVVTYADGSTEAIGTAFTRHTAPWNATGQPVITVPCGFDVSRMPVGLSFVGRPDQELELCDLAHAYERATGWFRHLPSL